MFTHIITPKIQRVTPTGSKRAKNNPTENFIQASLHFPLQISERATKRKTKRKIAEGHTKKTKAKRRSHSSENYWLKK